MFPLFSVLSVLSVLSVHHHGTGPASQSHSLLSPVKRWGFFVMAPASRPMMPPTWTSTGSNVDSWRSLWNTRCRGEEKSLEVDGNVMPNQSSRIMYEYRDDVWSAVMKAKQKVKNRANRIVNIVSYLKKITTTTVDHSILSFPGLFLPG